jgi:hypothetical protein
VIPCARNWWRISATVVFPIVLLLFMVTSVPPVQLDELNGASVIDLGEEVLNMGEPQMSMNFA